MSSLSEADSRCRPGDTICEIRVYEQEVIVVPVLFLFAFLIMLIFLLLLRFCPEKVDRIRPQNVRTGHRQRRARRQLQGIDAAPFGINPLEHESIALDVPPSYSTFVGPRQNLPFSVDEPAYATFNNAQPTSAMPPELPVQSTPQLFTEVSPLPLTFSMRAGDAVSLYRAKMGHRNVILRMLKESASASEKQSFLGFASFLSGLGAHPFLPAILGVVSLRTPLMLVVEELENRDMLSFLWKCRQDHVGEGTPCDLTEKRIFTMSNQVASALDYLHKREIIHGNVGARSVLVSRELTAKLWGLGNAYARKSQQAPLVEEAWLKKWQAPEVLARKEATQCSDVWSFGILLYEMVTLGDAPFADIAVNELMQYLQRGKTLKRPANCSNSLYSIIKSCCQWKELDRATLSEVSRKLLSGERSTSDKTVIRVPEPIDVEKYLQEAGYGETHNYTVF